LLIGNRYLLLCHWRTSTVYQDGSAGEEELARLVGKVEDGPFQQHDFKAHTIDLLHVLTRRIDQNRDISSDIDGVLQIVCYSMRSMHEVLALTSTIDL